MRGPRKRRIRDQLYRRCPRCQKTVFYWQFNVFYQECNACVSQYTKKPEDR